MNEKVHVREGDTVLVISGKNKGKKGKVAVVSPSEGKVIVQGVNIVTKHVKPKKQGQEGGIVKAEGAIYASKVMLFCTKCNKPTRIAKKVLESGTKVRVCKHCGEELGGSK